MPPKMYSELASWFHLITAPDDYKEEAASFVEALVDACQAPPTTVLELGSGGGNNASHMKQHFEMTLVDISAEMLALSKTLNPELPHLQGDMRNFRLGQQFDAVFVHDAISYMTTKPDLKSAIQTAWVHLKPGGAALFAPDDLVETFEEEHDSGGHTGNDGRGIRYLEWSYDPDPKDTMTTIDYAYVIHEPGKEPRVELDTHVTGLFPRATWLELFSDVGFAAESFPFEHSTLEPGSAEIFIAKKPA